MTLLPIVNRVEARCQSWTASSGDRSAVSKEIGRGRSARRARRARIPHGPRGSSRGRKSALLKDASAEAPFVFGTVAAATTFGRFVAPIFANGPVARRLARRALVRRAWFLTGGLNL